MIGLRHRILRLLYPLIRFAGKLRSPLDIETLHDIQIEQIIKAAQPGDIIGSYTEGEFSNWLLRGPIKHAGLVSWDDHVVEAKDPVVVERSLHTFLAGKSAAFLIRPRATVVDPYLADQAVQTAISLIGRNYDYGFHIPRMTEPNQLLYCSELVWWCYAKNIPHWAFRPRKVWGVPTIQPSDFLGAVQHFELVGLWTK